MNQSKTIAFHTLGCKLNFSETSAIRRSMEEEGLMTVDFSQEADVYVINTCSVTENADRKCRAAVRKARRINEDALVVVIGCYAQLKPEEISGIEGVSLVLGAREKFNLPVILRELTDYPCGEVRSGPIREVKEFTGAFSSGDRTRSFLKVQDGCDYKCSFCTIPLARGSSRSAHPDNVIRNARLIASSGVKEIVITGVNTGDYGKGLDGQIGLLDLVRRLDEEIDVPRFRISSIEPNLLTDQIIEFVASSKKFVPHFHVPLQSGSNEMLAAMRRRYRKELYTARVQAIRDILPDAAIGVDVIVGFPGEKDALFSETVEYLKSLEVSYLHVFTYSERANTVAPQLQGSVPWEVRTERSAVLRNLSDRIQQTFYKSHIGDTRPVLFEVGDGTKISGYTDNYIRVAVPYEESLVNEVIEVQLAKISTNNDLLVSGDLTVLNPTA